MSIMIKVGFRTVDLHSYHLSRSLQIIKGDRVFIRLTCKLAESVAIRRPSFTSQRASLTHSLPGNAITIEIISARFARRSMQTRARSIHPTSNWHLYKDNHRCHGANQSLNASNHQLSSDAVGFIISPIPGTEKILRVCQ
jgi:hypothetical protein